MNWTRLIASVCLAALVGCGGEEPRAKASKPTLICGEYPVANLAYQLGGADFKVIYPVPAGVDPAEWQPGEKKLGEMRAAFEKLGESGVLFASRRQNPPWFEKIRPSAKRIVEFPTTSPGPEPAAIQQLLNQVAAQMIRIAPKSKSAVEKRKAALTKKLDALAERWTENPAVELNSGRARPTQGDLFSIVEANLKKLESGKSPAVLEGVAIGPRPTQPDPNPLVLGEGYVKGILPVIDRYCIDCHDSDTEEGEVNFDAFITEAEAVRDPDFWDRVAAQIEMGMMPPHSEKAQPTDEQREAVIAWAADLGGKWDRAEFGRDPGRTTIRRLNKNEFNYTIRDLFGLKLRPADKFPEDGGGEAGFDNNADALFLPPLLMENYVEASGLVAQAIYADGSIRQRYLRYRPGSGLGPAEAAEKTLRFWASAAFRRPVRSEEIERLVRIFRSEMAKKKNYDAAMRKPLLAILISPNFLYRAEGERDSKSAYPVDNFDLASRLSYFLWSSMPDKRLFDLAASGELAKPEVIEAEVLRMLSDERSDALAMHFAGQWFGWELLRSRANPDEKRYPMFDFNLRVAMYRESAVFFEHLIETNASAYDLIDSDYSFLNERLARHYGVSGVSGNELRLVRFQNPNRGGVLGMGSVLVATSLPLRSSPALRGDYVLTEILGTPPPEPPMNVEQLPDDDQKIKARTFRQALEQHRQDPNCKACHEAIDPVGFSLENFDAIGRWRTKQNGKPIDPSGVMPDGSEVASPAELKQLLMRDKELFARVLVEKLLSYALGRELTPYDRPVIREITDKVIADEGRIRTAFVEVAKSYPFRHRRNDDFRPHASE